MVKSNKWDKKAKFQYMKKHGLLPEPSSQTPTTTPKWSSKKKSEKKPTIQLTDSDDEWDSDVDEVLINHFYPELESSEELSLQQKVKLKQQILNDLKEKEELGEDIGENSSEEKSDGQINLGDIIGNIDRRPKKKMLKTRFSDNLLEEYGLDGYQTSDKEYKLAGRKSGLSNLKDDFVIGQPEESSSIRSLTEEEIAIENERKKKIEQQNFYDEVRKKFGEKPTQQKIVDINNIKGDESQLQRLNDRIGKEKVEDTLDEDLNELLQLKLSDGNDTVPQRSTALPKPPKTEPVKSSGVKDIDFLDSLLK
ncbi:hypothetical protein I9W82_003646 [Candida metapsilosis]|uniref:Uncharacterized protein n=1 Tax=Candida metapsilosis TaxID=273372 RepID=A0A8H8DA64_9ASCO|nr:hypothetical protein I9W82_003646 [Candida metapsilosis]